MGRLRVPNHDRPSEARSGVGFDPQRRRPIPCAGTSFRSVNRRWRFSPARYRESNNTLVSPCVIWSGRASQLHSCRPADPRVPSAGRTDAVRSECPNPTRSHGRSRPAVWIRHRSKSTRTGGCYPRRAVSDVNDVRTSSQYSRSSVMVAVVRRPCQATDRLSSPVARCMRDPDERRLHWIDLNTESKQVSY